MQPLQDAIHQKTTEIEKWFCQSGLLSPLEKVSVEIRVVGRKCPRLKVDEEYELTETDWQLVFSINLTSTQRVFLEKLKQGGNIPTPVYPVDCQVIMVPGSWETLNLKLRGMRIPFRLSCPPKQCKGSPFWSEKSLKLYRLV